MNNEESNTKPMLNTDLKTASVAAVKPNWIKIVDGKFECGECGNVNQPETNTSEGVVVADLEDIKNRLVTNPNSDIAIWGVCPVCAMEYRFRLSNDDLYLEPSDMLK